MSFSCQKVDIDRRFNRLDQPVEKSRLNQQPDRPVDLTGAGRPDRCRSTRPVSISGVLTSSNYHQYKFQNISQMTHV